MKYLKFLIIGTLFGIIMTKSEAVSWYRIQEMFRFDSFHMYGIIGSTIMIGVVAFYLIRKFEIRSFAGNPIMMNPKEMGVPRYLFGGIIFGLGWALTGACPGPIYALIGNGFSVILVTLVSALFGTFVYGLFRNRLPH